MKGGFSHVFRIFLEMLLISSSGVATVGMPVVIPGLQRVIFAKVSNLLSEGDGHRLAWDWKGASSLKPCLKHFNVFKLGSDLAGRMRGYVEIGCADVTQFRSWTADQMFVAADSVASASTRALAGTITKAMQHEIEQSVGLNHNQFGLLMSPTMRSRALCQAWCGRLWHGARSELSAA